MIELDVTQDMIDKAKRKASDMGVLNNSITYGDGNVVGFIGEQIATQILGGSEKNTYDYDIVLPTGVTVDVKTKKTTVAPKEHYDCSVAAFNTKQRCDYYCFVRVKSDLTKAWFLGMYPKKQYYDDARFLKKGDYDGDNGYVVKADCYNMQISKLQNP